MVHTVVALGGHALVVRAPQVEAFDDGQGPQVELLDDHFGQVDELVVLDAHGFDAGGFGLADHVGELDEGFVAQAVGDQRLGREARHVGRAAVDLRRVLARVGAAADGDVRPVVVHDELATRGAGIGIPRALDEAAGAVDHGAFGQVVDVEAARLEHVLEDVSVDLFVADVLLVLDGDHERHEVVALHRHLALAVGVRPRHDALHRHVVEPVRELAREQELGRQHLGVGVAGVAGHAALVAGAAGVHALGDVGRLHDHVGDDVAQVAPCDLLVDLLDDVARAIFELGQRHVDLALAGQEGQQVATRDFGRHAADALLVRGQRQVDEGVGHGIADLVRVSGGDGFSRFDQRLGDSPRHEHDGSPGCPS